MNVNHQEISRALRQNDVLELSKLFEAEFNQPDMHDRVLMLDVMSSAPNVEENKSSKNEDCNSSKYVSHDGTADTEDAKIGMNLSDFCI